MSSAPSLHDADALRADLTSWTVDAVSTLVGDRAVSALDREQLVPARLAARASGDPIATLTRLFALGDTVTRAQLAAALPTFGVEGALASGLVAVSGHSDDDPVRALVDMRPFDVDAGGTWWVASDRGESVTGERLEGDHVLGVGGASLTLASITIREQVGRVLDIGTGCGIQALHASLHARSVVATDTSARALEFARFNASLAGVDVDLREGSLLEPVAGETFDLVVSNPPFVITPAGAPSFEYRDGGMAGDGIVSTLFASLGSVLAPGGIAQMLGNWEIGADGWEARIEGFLDASPEPLDAWVVQRDVLDAAEYAEVWLRDAGVVPERGRSAFDAAYEAYLADFDRRGVREVGFGMVLLRKSQGRPTLRRLEFLEGPVATPLGPELGHSLAAHDRLASLTDAQLLDERLTVAGDVTREVYGRPLLPEPEHILIRQGGGFGRAVRADTGLAGLVGACDGELSVGQILGALGALGVDHARELLPAVRELVETGMLV